MKIAVVCGYLDSFEPLAKYTVEVNKREYCTRHGYDLLTPRVVNPPWADPQSHAGGFSWSRMSFVLNLLQTGIYDWVWTVGADTLITNLSLNLEEIIAMAETPEGQGNPTPPRPKQCAWAPFPLRHHLAHNTRTGKRHLLICGERVTPVQADSFLLRNSPESIAYLHSILGVWPVYKHHPWVENLAMMDQFDLWANITFIVPQWRFNAYDYSRFYSINPCYRDGTDCYGNRGQWQSGDFLIHWPAATLTERLKFLDQYTPLIQQ